MLVYKRWRREKDYLRSIPAADCDGWFLFGLIPIYIRKVEIHQ